MSTFDLLKDLTVTVDGCELEPLSAATGSEHVRHCTEIHLHGGGLVGRGEDVTYSADEHVRFQAAGGDVHDLRGSWTIGELVEHTAGLDLFGHEPDSPVYRRYRLWAFHSAALDLALRQAGRPLHGVLGRAPEPMRYVASTRLGEPPSLDPVRRRLALDPTLRFKLDATSSWTPAIFDWLRSNGVVDTIDLKGLYRGGPVDQAADPELYRTVAETFPHAWIEDPDLSVVEAAAALAEHHDRITWDANIHAIADIEALPFKPRMVNVKPSRIGSLRELCDAYDYCAAEGIGAYGGGQTELGVGRGQAQYLAALFHADAPNDLAPAAYNLPDPPAGLPRSPLVADLSAPGFRWPS